jgi:hypothetical protein
MTFIRDDQIQAAWITSLKANTALTAEVAAAQIKEIQPQTTEFTYPGVRLRVGPNAPGEEGCPQDVTVRIAAFSENASSQQCMRIAGIIMQEYHDKSFITSGLSQSMQFIGIKADLVPVVRQDRRTWRAEVILNMVVSSG